MITSSIGVSAEGSSVKKVINNSEDLSDVLSEGSSASGTTVTVVEDVEKLKKEIYDHKTRISGLEKLEKKAHDTLGDAESAVRLAERINYFSIGFLFLVFLSFLFSVYGIWMDYSHNNDENRKYFSDLLKNYETKEDAAATIKELKDCIWYEGTKFCTRPR